MGCALYLFQMSGRKKLGFSYVFFFGETAHVEGVHMYVMPKGEYKIEFEYEEISGKRAEERGRGRKTSGTKSYDVIDEQPRRCRVT